MLAYYENMGDVKNKNKNFSISSAKYYYKDVNKKIWGLDKQIWDIDYSP